VQSYLTDPDVEFGEFVRAHSVADLEPPTIDGLVSTINREWIIVVRGSGETVLAACVQNDAGDSVGSREVVLLGCAVPDRAAAAVQILLGRVEQLARAGDGRQIDMQVPTALAYIAPQLATIGYRRASYNVDFELTGLEACHAVPHRMPEGARWQDVDEQTLRSARGCYERAFRIARRPGPPPLTDYSDAALSLSPRARLLMLDGEVIAFARVAWKDREAGLGEVRNLGRDPDVTLRGLGALALVEALRSLGAMGARRVMLTAASGNVRAIALYRAFGFTATERRVVLRKHLPPRR
jgi:ribosomal protein S18 acetylase RimI-like enzyme